MPGGNENSSSDISLINNNLKHIFKIFLYAVLFAVILKAFLIDAYQIPTGSMKNTLLIGDYIVVNKAAYSLSTPKTIPLTDIKIPSLKIIDFTKPKRNDVIVFEHPGYFRNEDTYIHSRLVKRIIGLPSDTILIKDNQVFVNGNKINSPQSAIIDSTLNNNHNFIDKKLYSFGKEWNKNNYGPIVIPHKGLTINLNSKNIKFWKLLIDNEVG